MDTLKDNDGDDCDIVLGFGIGGDGRQLQPLKVTAIRLITSLRGFGKEVWFKAPMAKDGQGQMLTIKNDRPREEENER